MWGFIHFKKKKVYGLVGGAKECKKYGKSEFEAASFLHFFYASSLAREPSSMEGKRSVEKYVNLIGRFGKMFPNSEPINIRIWGMGGDKM